MKKIIFFLFLFFSFLSVSNGYTETIVKSNLSNCVNESMPIAVNQKMNTWTWNVYFFCVSTADKWARIYNEEWDSIQTYWTWIYALWNWYDSHMELILSFDSYSDHYDLIWVSSYWSPWTNYWMYVIKNWVIINSFFTYWNSMTIVWDKIHFWASYHYTFSSNSYTTWIINNTNPITFAKILAYDSISSIESTIIYQAPDWKYYQTKWNYDAWWPRYVNTTREIFINKSAITSLFPLETLSFPTDLNTYTWSIISKWKLQWYIYNDWQWDDAVRYILSLCKESSTFKFTTTQDQHVVSLAWDLPSYNITDTIWFYDTKATLYYDIVKNEQWIVTYIWIKDKPFLPLQYFCASNYWYTDFSNKLPQSVLYLNNSSIQTYVLKKAILNSQEKDTIWTILWWGPWWTTTEQLNPDWSVTDNEVTEDLFNFDIDWDWEVEAWERALAPFTFLKNLVNKILISAQNFWKVIKSFQWLGNISFISYANASDTIWWQAFFDNFSNTFQWEWENNAMNDIAQKWKQTIYLILLLIVIIFWFLSLKKN